MVKVSADDYVGLLAVTCRWFADQGVSIQALQARTRGRRADDTFLLYGAVEARDLTQYLEGS